MRVFTFTLAVLAAANGFVRAADPVSPDTVICGPNAVYVMRKIAGQSVDQSSIAELMPDHPQGMSLADVAGALGRAGIPVQVRRCAAPDLLAAEPPFVVRVGGERTGGHYVIVLRVDGAALLVMDATSGYVYTSSLQRFGPRWEGYVVIRSEPVPSNRFGTLFGGLLAGVSAITVVFYLRRPLTKA